VAKVVVPVPFLYAVTNMDLPHNGDLISSIAKEIVKSGISEGKGTFGCSLSLPELKNAFRVSLQPQRDNRLI
jgi:hypothetical protein